MSQSTATGTGTVIEAEIFAKTPESVGNITFTPTGELVLSQHPFFEPNTRVVKLGEDRETLTPFPNEAWNTPRDSDDHYFDSVLGLRGDGNGVIWILDMGTRVGLTPKLVGWNTNTDQLERIYYVPAPASIPESSHNDFTMDQKRGNIILADEGIGGTGDGTKAALVIIDMETGLTRRRLQGHRSCLPEKITLNIEGKDMTMPDGKGGSRPVRIGADGIATDLDYEWLYFGPLSGGTLYRVRLDDIDDTSLSDAELGERVEEYSPKPNNGGITFDRVGNLYVPDVENATVGLIDPNTRQYSPFVTHELMVWPDGLSYAPDGYIYVSASQVPHGAPLNDGVDRTTKPFLIFRFPPLSPGRLGY